MSALIVDGLRKTFAGGSTAIDDVSVSLAEGAFTTLLGPSGCGKTTTLRCLAGLETPDAGRIRFGDTVFVDIQRGTLMPPHKRKLGMVFQSYALWPNRTVAGNVGYPLRLRGVSRAEAEKRAAEVLEMVGLGTLGARYPHELSGGQQQRVALARGLASASGLLLFDEPLSNLDAKLRLTMRTEIRKLHDEFGYSSVYVTHAQEEALAISDHVIVMNGGRIEQAGTPHEIFSRPRSAWVAGFVGFDNILSVDSWSVQNVSVEGGGELASVGETAPVPQGAQIAFRSKDVALAGTVPLDGPHYRMSGVVTASSYLGDAYRLEIGLGPVQGTTIVAQIPDSTRLQTPEKYLHDRVECVVAASDVIVL